MSVHVPTDRKKVTIRTLKMKKRKGEPISMMTAYDYSAAVFVERAGIDMILVGDSLGMVMNGFESTVPVTMDMMVYHAQAVSRGAKSPLLVGDLPFMSYQIDRAETLRNAARLMQDGGMDAVKLEGGLEVAETAKALVSVGIPVMGHIGLTPQTLSNLSGYRVQGKTADSARKLIKDAQALEAAGCFSIVLEAMPVAVANAVTAAVSIPTIGIGAGAGCDGQVLVYHDMLGMFDRIQPRFVKEFGNIGDAIVSALKQYHEEVKAGTFPSEAHTYEMKAEEEAEFLNG